MEIVPVEPNGIGVEYANLTYSFPFERHFDIHASKAWYRAYWHYSIYYSAVYLLLIYLGQRFMENRPAFNLRLPMAAWSGALALFSIAGVLRCYPYVYFLVSKYGVFTLLCDNTFHYVPPMQLWTHAFVTSKVYELGDTAFIVARKQKLVFLHWYHHITVFIFCWVNFPLDGASGGTFAVMNYGVHSVMYGYYMLRALRFSIPKQVNMCITALQIAQMFGGMFIVGAVQYWQQQGYACSESKVTIYFGAFIYCTYMVLFVNFFYQTYFRKAPKGKTE